MDSDIPKDVDICRDCYCPLDVGCPTDMTIQGMVNILGMVTILGRPLCWFSILTVEFLNIYKSCYLCEGVKKMEKKEKMKNDLHAL